MYIVSKILSFLFSPFNLILLLALMALFFHRMRRKLLYSALILLLVFSNPLLFRWAISGWENAPVALPENDVRCKYVVVLGGISAMHEESGRIRFSQSSDRLMQALMVAKQNPVEKIIISGGNASLIYDYRPESAYLADFLIDMGLEENILMVDSISRNTYENALQTRLIFEKEGLPLNICLVTSAWHMPRARRCFEKQGFKVTPVNTDFMRPMRRITPGEILVPSLGALSGWDILFREWFGLAYYRIRRYI